MDFFHGESFTSKFDDQSIKFDEERDEDYYFIGAPSTNVRKRLPLERKLKVGRIKIQGSNCSHDADLQQRQTKTLLTVTIRPML